MPPPTQHLYPPTHRVVLRVEDDEGEVHLLQALQGGRRGDRGAMQWGQPRVTPGRAPTASAPNRSRPPACTRRSIPNPRSLRLQQQQPLGARRAPSTCLHALLRDAQVFVRIPDPRVHVAHQRCVAGGGRAGSGRVACSLALHCRQRQRKQGSHAQACSRALQAHTPCLLTVVVPHSLQVGRERQQVVD